MGNDTDGSPPAMPGAAPSAARSRTAPVTGRFPRTDVSVPAARSLVRHALAQWHVIDRSDDVLLCLTELATNAVRHGLRADDHFLVKAGMDGGRLRVEVHDTSRRRPRPRHPNTQDPTGRGLLLVETLADEWGVRPRAPRGKVVWIEFTITAQHLAEVPST